MKILIFVGLSLSKQICFTFNSFYLIFVNRCLTKKIELFFTATIFIIRKREKRGEVIYKLS